MIILPMRERRCVMKVRIGRLAVILALAALAMPAWAQRRHYPMSRYDASAEVTLKGTVTEVKTAECDMCPHTGTHLMLKTGDKSMEVMLGPTAFLKEHDFTFAKDDEVEVTGAKVKMGDEDQLLARKVKKGEKTLTLRDKSGKPMWAGGPHR